MRMLEAGTRKGSGTSGARSDGEGAGAAVATDGLPATVAQAFMGRDHNLASPKDQASNFQRQN
jgi:hypothetical protein